MATADKIERTEPARLLVYDGMQLKLPLQRHTDIADRLGGGNAGGNAAFHVERAPTIHLAVNQFATEGVLRPEGTLSFRHHIDMAAKD